MYQPGNYTPLQGGGYSPYNQPSNQPSNPSGMFPGQPYQPNAYQPNAYQPNAYQPNPNTNPYLGGSNPYSNYPPSNANQAYVNQYYAQMMESQRLLNIKLAQEREYARRQPVGPEAPVDPGGQIRKYDHVLYAKAGDPACDEAVRLCKYLDNVFVAFLDKIPAIPPCVTRVPTIVDSLRRLVYPPHLCGRYIQELNFLATSNHASNNNNNNNNNNPPSNTNFARPRVTSLFRDPNSATAVISGCDIASNTHDPRCKPPSAGAFNLNGAYPTLHKMASLNGSADYAALLAHSDRLIKEAKERAQLMQDRPPEAVNDTATPQEQALIDRQMAEHLERIKQNVKNNNTPTTTTTTTTTTS